jgi:hypothetical protein
MLTSLVRKEVSYAYESQSNIAWYFAGCKFPGKTTMLWITDTYRVVLLFRRALEDRKVGIRNSEECSTHSHGISIIKVVSLTPLPI